jgi:hypothetical protein
MEIDGLTSALVECTGNIVTVSKVGVAVIDLNMQKQSEIRHRLHSVQLKAHTIFRIFEYTFVLFLAV